VSHASERGRRRAVPPERAGGQPAGWPPWWALIVVAAWAALLLLAPPGSARLWGFNAFRSLSVPAALTLLALAAASPRFVMRAWRAPRAASVALALALALLLAFPLRERLHVLGDTQLRIRTVAYQVDPSGRKIGFSGLVSQLHTQPLDSLVNVYGVCFLAAHGLKPEKAGSLVSFLLAALYIAGVARLARVLTRGVEDRAILCTALVLGGTLQAFAGYAESAGLMLVAAVWWWAALLVPVDGRAPALRVAGAWIVLFMSHRLGLVMLLPQAWRAIGTPLEGDRPEARRLLLALTAAELVLAAMWLQYATPGVGLARDLREFLGSLRSDGGPRLTPASDALTLVALLSPLVPLAALLAGREARAAARGPELPLMLAAAVPLLPTLFVFPVAPSGLGAQRDWDLAALLALSLTAGAGVVLARLPAPRLRSALAVAMPVLVLQAGSWVAVNADERAAAARIETMVAAPGYLRAEQRSHAHVFLAYRAAEQDRMAVAAQNFEDAFAALPNLRNELLAAEAWTRAGDPAAARRALALARRGGPLPPQFAPAGALLDSAVLRLEEQQRAGGMMPR